MRITSFTFRAMFSLGLLAGLAFHAGALHAQKTAILAISPSLGTMDRVFAFPRVVFEKDTLQAAGYNVRMVTASAATITAALADPQVRALSYFGHGIEPAIENMTAGGWKNHVYLALYNTYAQQGRRDAQARAALQVQNFGLDLMRMHSCSSFTNNSLALQFVRVGGIYSGVSQKNYQPCPTLATLRSDVQFVLDDYRVPGTPTGIPQGMNQCEQTSGQKICGTFTANSAQQYFARWDNGASAMLTIDRFDQAWVVFSRYDTTGTSAGLSALYIGERSGNQVLNGTVTWYYHGKSWSGNWAANFAVQGPPGRGGGA